MLSFLIQKLIWVYQKTISPNHGVFREYFKARGVQCRFYPTCSEYMSDAVAAHGIAKGALLGAKRLARCRPRGGAGYDPVTQELIPTPLPIRVRSDFLSFARRDEETIDSIMTRSNEAGEENHTNPEGCGPAGPDTASLLLGVECLHLRRRSLSRAGIGRYRGWNGCWNEF